MMSHKKNTMLNLMGALVPIAVTLITVPIYLKLIGTERYGALAILWTLMGYFGFINLGLGRAVAQRLADAGSRSPYARSGLVWTALTMTLVLGTLGGLVLWLTSDLILTHWVDMSPQNLVEAKAAVTWLVVAMPLIFGSSILSGALHGRQHFLVMNLLVITGSTLAQVVPLGVAALGHVSLAWLVPAALSGRVITFAINYRYCRRRLPLRGRPHFHSKYIKPLLSFGGWVSVSSIMAPLLTTIDRIIIGAMAGLTAVTHYTIPYNLSFRLTVFSGSYASALFPLMAAEKNDRALVLINHGLRNVAALTTPFFVLAEYLVQWFFSAWISREFALQAAPIAQLLIAGFYFNNLAILYCSYTQAIGRPGLVAKSHLVQLPIYIVLLFVFLSQWGVVGAAFATSLRMVMDFAFLLLITRQMKYTILAIWYPTLLFIAAHYINYFRPGSDSWLIWAFLINIFLSLIFAYRTYDRTGRRRLLGII